MTKAALQDLNILIVGVGGQGTSLASRILAQVAQDAGYDVKVSEIHGMSQRGGSVTTQVRCSQRVAAPIITPGTVDVALAFERLEALRALPWLKEGGTIIINQQELMPMPVITGAAAYPADITEKIQAAAQLTAQVTDDFLIQNAQGRVNDQITALFHQRDEAKKAKNYAEADRIRAELNAMGIQFKDIPGGVELL